MACLARYWRSGEPREFLERAALGAMGAVIPAPAETLRLDRIGLQLYTVRKLMEASVALTLEQVRKIGYREVEFAGYFGAQPSQLRHWLDDLGLTAPAAHVPLQDTKLEELMDAAAVVGHQYLVLASLPLTQRVSLNGYRRAATLLNRAGEQARRRGLEVAYHNHDFEFKDRGGIVPYDVLLAETDPALVWFEVDFYWMAKAGRDPLRYFAAHGGRFRLCHLKDIDERGKITEVGRGRLDFQALLRRRNQAGLRHFFVEHDNPREPLESIRDSYRHARSLS
jgi:sugar phosphate isomerase/epimerase